MEVPSGPFVSGAIIAAVPPPLIPVIAGLVALAAGVLVLRTYGPRYRVGRLLAATPDVTVAEARALSAGKPHYVRIRGRWASSSNSSSASIRPRTPT